METILSTMNPWGFAILMVVMLVSAFVYSLTLKPAKPTQGDLENAPEFYTTDNTEIGEEYPIISIGFDGVKFSHQYFVVNDKLDDLMHIAVYQVGEIGQGRPFIKGWINKLDSQIPILPSQLTVSYHRK